MKIAVDSSVGIQLDGDLKLLNYFLVPDDYNFTLNKKTNITSASDLLLLLNNNRISIYGINFDYGSFRDSLKNNLLSNWQNLSFEERKIMITHFVYPTNISSEEWGGYFTELENFNNWSKLVIHSREEQRLKRLYAAFSRLTYDFLPNEVVPIYFITKPMCIDYWLGNMPHLVLWISNGTFPALGIDYSVNGFAQMSGYTTTKRDAMLSILTHGNY